MKNLLTKEVWKRVEKLPTDLARAFCEDVQSYASSVLPVLEKASTNN